MSQQLKRVLLVGDNFGISQLLRQVDNELVVGLVGASIRPRDNQYLRKRAAKLGVPFCNQPKFTQSVAYSNFLNSVKALKPDGIICHSYSMLIREDFISLVDGNAFNIHYALLPRHRGPNPIQWALIHGDFSTGATIHLMDRNFDEGDIVDQVFVDISDNDTWKTLLERVNEQANLLLEKTLPDLIRGTWSAKKQDTSKALKNSRIKSESFPIVFSSMTDREIFNLIRAQVSPLSGAYLDTPSGQIRFKEFLSINEVRSLRIIYDKETL